MMTRLWIPALALVLCVSGFAVVADALVTSDAERLDAFLDAASANEGAERAAGVSEYANPDEVELRVESDGEVQLFGPGQGEELDRWLRDTLDVFHTADQRLLQHSTQLTGPGEARVTTRVRDEDQEQTVIYHLVKRDGQWRVSRMRVL